jgi:hypothetical protein
LQIRGVDPAHFNRFELGVSECSLHKTVPFGKLSAGLRAGISLLRTMGPVGKEWKYQRKAAGSVKRVVLRIIWKFSVIKSRLWELLLSLLCERGVKATCCVSDKLIHSNPKLRLADKEVTWLILPVVICLSQRLSHACLSINNFIL